MVQPCPPHNFFSFIFSECCTRMRLHMGLQEFTLSSSHHTFTPGFPNKSIAPVVFPGTLSDVLMHRRLVRWAATPAASSKSRSVILRSTALRRPLALCTHVVTSRQRKLLRFPHGSPPSLPGRLQGCLAALSAFLRQDKGEASAKRRS